MQRDRDGLVLSPTDVAVHLACRHLTQLERDVKEGRLRVELRPDPRAEALAARGLAHEAQYVESLRLLGRTVVDLRDAYDPARTLATMREGHDVIVQPPLAAGRFTGRADVLRRLEAPSALGTWSYEPEDTKLARETRAGTILQLCTYAVLLDAMQGMAPAEVHVVTPLGRESYRTDHFAAYVRFVRRRLEGDLASPPATYPDPVPHCDVCRYWFHCATQRRQDDHLSLVAGMRRLNLRELERQQVRRVVDLAALTDGLPERPQRGSIDTYEGLAHQARLQVAARTTLLPPYEPLAIEPDRGLARLPEPSAGDVFLDFEGDPFVGDSGLEYLTGWAFRDGARTWTYERRWALDRRQERVACEAFVDFVMRRLETFPDLHVYHFGAYEPAALKRLVSRHATRAEELDRLLRGRRFVDLHAVVREGLRVGVERYGLKELEPLIGFRREGELREAAAARLALEVALEMGASDVDDALRDTVGAYNREDCLSAAALRAWLEARRAESRETISRPTPADDAPSDPVRQRDRRIADAAAPLLSGVPDDPAARDDDQHARWLLGNMLGYFRREERCAWWEHFRLRGLERNALLEERDAVAGLAFVEELPNTSRRQRLPVHRYTFPAQETALDDGDRLQAPELDDADGGDFATVVRIDLTAGEIDIKKTARSKGMHPWAVFKNQVVSAEPLERSLLAFAEHVRTAGLDADGPYRAASDLLGRRPPRRRGGAGGRLRRPGEALIPAALRLCAELDGGVLPIQGPPGSGKTYIGARAIVALAKAGKRVGVTAVSHKVIANLLGEVVVAAREAGAAVRVAQLTPDDAPPGVERLKANDDAHAAVGAGIVGGGTAWLWADDDAQATLDYLFVDEAGQMALACVLAAARAARNLVLLGDPQQLEQPRKGAHPDGTDVAALVHVLGDAPTIGDAQGLFLDRTWRLHPRVCAFTSEAYYERRLEPIAGLDRQAIVGDDAFAGSGLVLVEVAHEGNQARALEEVDAVYAIVDRLLVAGRQWVDETGAVGTLAPTDVLVLAPYNAQVGALRGRLRSLGVDRVGTVDKFQGQEAAVVVYSCTSSSPEDAPRGMDFLYDPHRFNVATSRARALVIVVASPRLFAAECRTPAQMRKVNGLCLFREKARRVEL
jgi:uncharacterized protein